MTTGSSTIGSISLWCVILVLALFFNVVSIKEKFAHVYIHAHLKHLGHLQFHSTACIGQATAFILDGFVASNVQISYAKQLGAEDPTPFCLCPVMSL